MGCGTSKDMPVSEPRPKIAKHTNLSVQAPLVVTQLDGSDQDAMFTVRAVGNRSRTTSPPSPPDDASTPPAAVSATGSASGGVTFGSARYLTVSPGLASLSVSSSSTMTAASNIDDPDGPQESDRRYLGRLREMSVRSLHNEVERYVDELLRIAADFEPQISGILQQVSTDHGGYLQGLDHRLKQRKSIARKAYSAVETANIEALEHWKRHGEDRDEDQSVRSVLYREVNDALRYTIVFPHDDYTRAARTTLARLDAAGFTAVDVKNFWEPGDSYQGINATFSAPGQPDFRWELQLHTPESFQNKMDTHVLYERYRAEYHPEKKMELFHLSIKACEDVRVPDDAMSIPKLHRKPQPDVLHLWALHSFHLAEQAEPVVTEMLLSIFGDRLQGLEYKLKAVSDLQRKFLLLSQGLTSAQYEEVYELIDDSLRYTAVMDDVEYADRIKSTVYLIEASGHSLLRTENHWMSDLIYQGYHAVFRTPSGVHFELQYHTPSSYLTKETYLDPLFEEYRDCHERSRRSQLFKEMANLWKTVAVPPRCEFLYDGPGEGWAAAMPLTGLANPLASLDLSPSALSLGRSLWLSGITPARV